jgi:hypothetical protein
MPRCPALACKLVLGSTRVLGVHISKSPDCKAWIQRQPVRRYDPQDLDQWPSVQTEPGDLPPEDNLDYDDYDYEMDSMEVDPPVEPPLGPPSLDPPPVSQNGHYVPNIFPKAAATFGKGHTPYDQVKAAEIDPNNPAYPFAGEAEWDLAYWLGTYGIPNTHIDEFLKLSWVRLIV